MIFGVKSCWATVHICAYLSERLCIPAAYSVLLEEAADDLHAGGNLRPLRRVGREQLLCSLIVAYWHNFIKLGQNI